MIQIIFINEWSKELKEFDIIPRLAITKSPRLIALNIGWGLWGVGIGYLFFKDGSI